MTPINKGYVFVNSYTRCGNCVKKYIVYRYLPIKSFKFAYVWEVRYEQTHVNPTLREVATDLTCKGKISTTVIQIMAP